MVIPLFQVKDKTEWDLGVAKESINRKGTITVRPDSGYWAICRRKGGSLIACISPSLILQMREIPQKVGIFLDYQEGSVSFYDAEAKTHIYTYSECNFTEPLYPYFNPCCHDNGKNTAPLVICPLEVTFNEEPAPLWTWEESTFADHSATSPPACLSLKFVLTWSVGLHTLGNVHFWKHAHFNKDRSKEWRFLQSSMMKEEIFGR